MRLKKKGVKGVGRGFSLLEGVEPELKDPARCIDWVPELRPQPRPRPHTHTLARTTSERERERSRLDKKVCHDYELTPVPARAGGVAASAVSALAWLSTKAIVWFPRLELLPRSP